MLLAVGILLGGQAAVFACLAAIEPGHSSVGRRTPAALLLAGLIFAALSYVCIRGAQALTIGWRSGANVGAFMALCLFAFSGDLVFDFFHPERQSADEYFLFILVPFFIALGMWWCIYLNLPHVRAFFRRHQQLEK